MTKMDQNWVLTRNANGVAPLQLIISRADIGLPVYPRLSVLGGKNNRILRVIHTLIKHNTAHKLVAL